MKVIHKLSSIFGGTKYTHTMHAIVYLILMGVRMECFVWRVFEMSKLRIHQQDWMLSQVKWTLCVPRKAVHQLLSTAAGHVH